MKMNIFSLLLTIVFCLLGLGSSVAIVGYMIVIIVQKIYNKIAHGASLYNWSEINKWNTYTYKQIVSFKYWKRRFVCVYVL